MNIVQVITPSKVSGAERSTMALCRGLSARGHDVCLVCKSKSALIDVAAREGVNVVPMHIQGKANLSAPIQIARFAHRRGADLIATHLSTASVWGSVAGRLLGIPVVATVRALNRKTCFLLAHKLIAVCEAVKRHLVAQGVRPERIAVVHNGIDSTRFVPPKNLAAAKCRVHIPPEKLVVGVVAHLTKKKGHEWFLSAAAKVHREVPRAYFLLLGDGPERSPLEARARFLGIAEHVRFAGFQRDVLPWTAAMDLVVLPSIAMEGLPRALLEAGAMGKPLIGSPVGGMPEIVQDGSTGFIVPTNDTPALTEAMIRLLRDQDLRRRMGRAGRRRILQHFTQERTAMKTEKVYEELLRAHAQQDSLGSRPLWRKR